MTSSAAPAAHSQQSDHFPQSDLEPSSQSRQERQRAFSQWLTKARMQAGMNQKQLAEVTEAANTQISRYERGANLPSRDNVLRLAHALDADPAEALQVAGYAPRVLPTRRRLSGIPSPELQANGTSQNSPPGNIAQIIASSYAPPIQLAIANDLATRADLIRSHKALEEKIEELHAFMEQIAASMGREDKKTDSKAIGGADQKKPAAATQGASHILNLSEFKQELEYAFSDACERSVSLSLILIDVDNLKAYNDTFGHHEGDNVLKIIADLLTQTARPTDRIARLLEDRGQDWLNRYGDQYALLMRETGKVQAYQILAEYKQKVASYDWPHRDITVSTAIATRTGKMINGRELLQRAADELDKQRETTQYTHP